jgi:hypothetical protein
MTSSEPLGGGKLIAWRLDQARLASTWDSGEGAFQVGGVVSPHSPPLIGDATRPNRLEGFDFAEG